jgi:hypothetical protein
MDNPTYFVVLLNEGFDEQGRYEQVAKLSTSIWSNSLRGDRDLVGDLRYDHVVVVQCVSDCDLKTALAECNMDNLPVDYNTHTNLTTGKSLRSICSLAFLVDKERWDEYWKNSVSCMGYGAFE